MSNRLIVVTGANSGIGRATTLELARRGYKVTGTVRDAIKARALTDDAASQGLEVETIILDVRDPEAPAELSRTRNLYGLVNNAGFSTFGAIEDVEDERVSAQVATMLVAPMRMARAVIPGMLARAEGRILNVSSIFAFATIPFNGWYQAVKHGLEAATDALRNEVAGSGIQVISVQPGAVATDLWTDHQSVVERYPDSRHIRAYGRSLQFMARYRRLMSSPEGVARVIADSLAAKQPKRRYLVGADAHVVAGMTLILPRFVQDAVTRRVLGL